MYSILYTVSVMSSLVRLALCALGQVFGKGLIYKFVQTKRILNIPPQVNQDPPHRQENYVAFLCSFLALTCLCPMCSQGNVRLA